MKKRLFPRRIGRVSWFFRLIALGVTLSLILATEPSSPLRQYAPSWFMEFLGWLILVGGVGYVLFFIHLPRARSLGLHGGYLLLILITPLNILLGMMLLFGSEGYWTRLRQRQAPPTPNQSMQPTAGRSDA
jgi:hypothetical protein